MALKRVISVDNRAEATTGYVVVGIYFKMYDVVLGCLHKKVIFRKAFGALEDINKVGIILSRLNLPRKIIYGSLFIVYRLFSMHEMCMLIRL